MASPKNSFSSRYKLIPHSTTHRICKRHLFRILLLLTILCLLSGYFIFNSSYSYSLDDNAEPEFDDSTRNFDINDNLFSNKYDEILAKLGLNFGSSNVSNQNFKDDSIILSSDPILISAFSDNHYHEAISMLDSVRKWYNKKIIVIYDLGISSYRIRNLKAEYGEQIIDVKKFNFDEFPPCVRNLYQYRWKPIIIAQELANYPSILWIDSSIVIQKSLAPITDVFKVCAKNVTSCPFYPWLMFSSSNHSIRAATNPAVYKYFPMSKNGKNLTMFEANRQLIYGTKFTKKRVLRPWILCALDDNCMAPVGSILHCDFHGRPYGTYANCHRFDQAILNILLTLENNFDVKRYNGVDRFGDYFTIKKNNYLKMVYYYLFH